MKQFIIALVLLFCITGLIGGCSSQEKPEMPKLKLSEQDVRNTINELINGINNGDVEVVKKYVGAGGAVAEQLIEKLKGNIKLSNVRDINIQGTTAQATVTLEVVPLNIKKDVYLSFNITDVLLLNNPLGLLSLLL
ncbi:MAG: hypothetical protein ACOX86_12375 [Pelotomaculaceae bacterium]|jgi:hypothetical protein